MQKKCFLTVLALGMGLTANCSAAASPFADVPADHWAYDAVAQLAEDGILEGYGDKSFRGNRQITRYEMAQMVARARAKNSSGEDKVLVDKLTAEFRAELENGKKNCFSMWMLRSMIVGMSMPALIRSGVAMRAGIARRNSQMPMVLPT